MTEITDKIYYVGVNDRNKHRFEGLWPLPNGVSYNSYIIDDEKVALVDTVEVDFFTQFLENIHEVIGDREIDYLIINHMEPDHSGSPTVPTPQMKRFRTLYSERKKLSWSTLSDFLR